MRAVQAAEASVEPEAIEGTSDLVEDKTRKTVNDDTQAIEVI